MFAVFANIMDFLHGDCPTASLFKLHSVDDMFSFVHHFEMKRFTQMHTKGLTYTPRPWLPRNCSVNAKHPGQQSLHPSKHHLRLGNQLLLLAWSINHLCTFCVNMHHGTLKAVLEFKYSKKMSTHAASLFLLPEWPCSLPERYLYIGCSWELVLAVHLRQGAVRDGVLRYCID